MPISTRIIAATVAGAIAVGGLVAVPAVAQEVSEQAAQHDGPFARWRAERREARQQAMADQLGVPVEEYRAALQAAHEAGVAERGPIDPSDRPTDDELAARRDAFQAALAGELGITVEELRADARVVLDEHLTAAVERGRITEEEAARVLRAFDEGTLGQQLRDHVRDRLDERQAD
jgi:hypothetical protein